MRLFTITGSHYIIILQIIKGVEVLIDLNAVSMKIINARKEKGFTQEELAVRLGVSAQAVSKWERALSLPDIELLLDLSRILNVSVEDLLENKVKNKSFTNTPLYDIGNSELLKQSISDQMIVVSFGMSLIPCFVPDYVKEFSNIRVNILHNMGVLLPAIRIMDNCELPEYKCVLTLFGEEVWSKIYEESIDIVQIDILSSVKITIQNHLPEFVNRHMIKLLVESLKVGMPFIVDGVIPERIELSLLRTILKFLVSRQVSIRNLVKIIENLDELIDDIDDRQLLMKTMIERLNPAIDF